jgi:hypothetical protein
MTPAGWVFMLLSLAFVWGLAGWCYARVLRGGATDDERDRLDHPEDAR